MRIAVPARVSNPHDDFRVFRKSEVAEDAVDRLIAAGELRTLRPRKRGVVVQIPAPSLRECVYGES
ncbi:DNA-binding protein [Gordonia sp. HY285]|uniref:DNA-binding protein n=1 Tax=Gordonia liuliyuniae TaxID=2911517 RepID=UPI001F423A46|nr:DNA-binding protein [Gordonia liuliyuniae]MCF8610753.1 DNA-binding protein [Gordonia liuliyuniae]